MDINKDLINGARQAPEHVYKAIEELEDWAIKDPEIEKQLQYLLDNFNKITKDKNIDKEIFTRVLTYLYTSDMMKIIEVIEDKDKKFMDDLIFVINDLNQNCSSRFSLTFSSRIMVLYRMVALPKIFSKENIEKLKNGIKKTQEGAL